MPVSTIIRLLKLLSRLKNGRLIPPRYINIGFSDSNARYRHISMSLSPTLTASHATTAVRTELNLPPEARLWIVLLPYGFEIEDYRIHSILSHLTNFKNPQDHLKHFMPRRGEFPRLPGRRYVGRKISGRERVKGLLKPWKQDALHFWVGVDDRWTAVQEYCKVVDVSICVTQERQDVSLRCQGWLREEVGMSYGLFKPLNSKNTPTVSVPQSTTIRPLSVQGGDDDGGEAAMGGLDGTGDISVTSISTEKGKRYRCQITDEFLTGKQVAATLVHPYSLMFEIQALNPEKVKTLGSSWNGLLMYEPLVKMFDEFHITIQRRQDNTDTQNSEVEGRSDFVFKVVNTHLLNRPVFAKEDVEGLESRRVLRYSDLDGKDVWFSEGNNVTPADLFIDWHAKLAVYLTEGEERAIKGQRELDELERASPSFLTHASVSSLFSHIELEMIEEDY
ncbi:hypothetical protein TWF694_005730 [Orbilia ellipsospora]|uniref:HNH nuclease domain-containing protein n=1 Tax=Orbilia ellipsospora TaxID=2528407 RepID=A0AAV9WSU6_9PEZI